MVLNSKDLSGVPVRTKSGVLLGKCASLDLDSDTGRLEAIRVKARGFVSGLLGDVLVVPWSSILELNDKLIIVADAAVPAGATVLAADV